MDDLLILMNNGDVKAGLIAHLRTLWEMSTEIDLRPDQPITFLGLELEMDKAGHLAAHQKAFIKKAPRRSRL